MFLIIVKSFDLIRFLKICFLDVYSIFHLHIIMFIIINHFKQKKYRYKFTRRFNLYLKLFIVMGINWSMEIISWLFKSAPQYIWYLTDLTNTLQGLIIFIIFVWKEKVKRLLLKRFGCQNRDLFSRNSTRSVAYHSSASRTCTTSIASGVIPLQEKVNPYMQTNYRGKNSSDEADP